MAALAAGLAVLASVTASAHRRDEYLQAARIGIDPGGVHIELDLTAGIDVASGIIGEIDRDRNGVFDTDETHMYSKRVLRELRVELDGRPLSLAVIDRRFPTPAAMSAGEGTIQLQFRAPATDLTSRTHRILYRNDHRPDIGVYLANALMPASDQVTTVKSQTRAVDQRDLVIEYALDGRAARSPVLWWLAAGLVIGLAAGADAAWQRRMTARHRRRTDG